MLIFFTLPALAKNTILVLGDSISAAYGLNLQQGWVALLKQRLAEQHDDYQVINASVSGDTTSNGLLRLPQALATYQPSITIIELGGNDGLRGMPIQTIKQNLQKMISLAKTQGSKVLLLGLQLPPNYGPEYTQAFKQMYLDIAKTNNIVVVPLFLNKIDINQAFMQADGIHPNANAQNQLLENMWPSLKSLLK